MEVAHGSAQNLMTMEVDERSGVEVTVTSPSLPATRFIALASPRLAPILEHMALDGT